MEFLSNFCEFRLFSRFFDDFKRQVDETGGFMVLWTNSFALLSRFHLATVLTDVTQQEEDYVGCYDLLLLYDEFM